MTIQISLKEQVAATKYVRDIPVGNVVSLDLSSLRYLVCANGQLVSVPSMTYQAGGSFGHTTVDTDFGPYENGTWKNVSVAPREDIRNIEDVPQGSIVENDNQVCIVSYEYSTHSDCNKTLVDLKNGSADVMQCGNKVKFISPGLNITQS